jgi:primase/DNA polymerase family protein
MSEISSDFENFWKDMGTEAAPIAPAYPPQPDGEADQSTGTHNGISQQHTPGTAPSLSALLSPVREAIPDFLIDLDRWVCWRGIWDPRKKKYDKPPFTPQGYGASSTNPKSWSPFSDAWIGYEKGGLHFSGIGFVLDVDAAEDLIHLIGVDFDHCLTLDASGQYLITDARIARWVEEIDTYTEISPSGEGLRLFLIGVLPPGGRKGKDIEVYESGRYLTVTGRSFHAHPKLIANRQSQIEKFHAEAFPNTGLRPDGARPEAIELSQSDGELLEIAFRAKNGKSIKRLFDGDMSAYNSALTGVPDHSAADLALCSKLVFYSGGSPERLDRFFRASRLIRPKWDKRHYSNGDTYGQRTIELALNNCREFFGQKKRDRGELPATGATDETPTADMETAVQEVDALVIEPIGLFDGKLVFTIVIAPRGRAGIEVYKEGEFVYEDEIYLPRATQRTRFINKIAKMVELPEGGSDDIERALLQKSKEIQDALKEESKKKPEKKSFKPGQVYCPYHESEQGIVWDKPIMGSGELDGLTQPVTLTNFNAKVLSNITRDDGTEPITVFEIAVGIVGEPSAHKGTVRADQFSSMGWPVKIAGSNAVIYAGKIEHARAAIQLLSKNVQKRYVIAHTGWRNDNEEWLFYHGAGAIGAKGLVQVNVELPPSLKPCALPPPPKGQKLREVVRAVAVGLRKLGPDRITLPSIGSAHAAVLTGADFSLFLLGTTGKFKTELAALIQSFFGKDFDDKHLPADWKWTALSIQETAHIAKDMVCVVDDFVPKGTPIAQARMHEKGETVMRGQANGSGRGRCNPDGTVRPERPPRGLLVVTGEDLPHGQSLVARMLALPVEEGDISAVRLTACQEKRRQGVYAEANSAFVQWLASDNRIEKLKKQAPDKIHELRTVWAQNGIDIHKKVANTLAQLERAWGVWLDFALECGGITSEEKAELSTAVHSALDVAGREHARFLGNENPATRFIELLKAAISSGRAYIAAPLDNGVPSADADVWGWEREVFRIEGKVVDEWQSKGDRIGWIEGDDVYLQPDAAYKMAQSMGTNGEGLTISSRTLWRRMKEEDYWQRGMQHAKPTRFEKRSAPNRRTLSTYMQKISFLGGEPRYG